MFSERKGQRMGENRAYCDDDDDEVFNGGFMKLLGCEDVFEKRVRVEEEFLFSPPCSLSSSSTTASSSSSSSSAGCYPQMLQFGGGHEEFLLFNSNNSYSLSAAAAAAPSPTGRSRARPCKKVEINGGGPGGGRKPKAAGFAGTIKVRKEKLGERINALQQLISPFGKTDTATVLHEAIGYIRFLHDQVQVLSSPYMQQFPLSSHQTEGGGDLRSRGLCLVPVSCTEDVANKSSISTGADLWSPAALGGGSSSSSSGSRH